MVEGKVVEFAWNSFTVSLGWPLPKWFQARGKVYVRGKAGEKWGGGLGEAGEKCGGRGCW